MLCRASRLISVGTLLLILAVTALAAAGCGNSAEKAGLETYLDALKPGMESFVTANNAGSDALNTDQSTGDYAKSMKLWQRFIDGYHEAAQQLGVTDVPSSMASAHAQWIDSIQAQADSADRYGAGIRSYAASYAASGRRSKKTEAKLAELYAQVKADQQGVIASMQSWEKTLQDVGNRVHPEVPGWWKDLMSQVRYRNTP